MIDVDFSLSLNNRTGKFFAARNMINIGSEQIASVHYWRLSLRTPPSGLRARALGWFMAREIELRVQFSVAQALPLVRSARPMLFTDPLQIIYHRLEARDCVVVHDVGPVTHPQFYHPGVQPTYSRIFDRVEKTKPHIVFVSEATRMEYEKLYGRAYRSGRTIYNPMRLEARRVEATPHPEISKPFLLTVGAVGWRKNQRGVLKAFEASGLARSGFSLVLCGGPEPGFEDVRDLAVRTPGAILMGYAAEGELKWLYENAAGFVLLSRLEGFGMPAAEATDKGLVSLLSTDAALREVAGEGALYVDSEDVEAAAQAMKQLVTMSEEDRHARLELGRLRLLAFSDEQLEAAWRLLFSDLNRY